MDRGSAGAARFITLEGPDGAGKSSQTAGLVAALSDLGLPVRAVREPGGTPLGEAIRELVLETDAEGGEHAPLVDALLFVAARARLVDEVIRPALAEGLTVLCDRFADSTLAYQGYGGGLDLDWLRQLNERATGGLRPDLTILFDLPVEVGLARRADGPSIERTRFEGSQAHDLAFHERVRDGYREMAASEPDRWRVIDASRDPDAVAAEVLAIVSPLLAPNEPIGASVRINR